MNDVTLNNINGIGQIIVPTETIDGSGDLMFDLKLNKKKRLKKYNQFISEASAFDEITSKKVQKSPEQQRVKNKSVLRKQLKVWYKKRKELYDYKIKKAETKEEKEILANNFKLEVIKKKKQYAQKMRKINLQKVNK